LGVLAIEFLGVAVFGVLGTVEDLGTVVDLGTVEDLGTVVDLGTVEDFEEGVRVLLYLFGCLLNFLV
jgi:hypothetical protein